MREEHGNPFSPLKIRTRSSHSPRFSGKGNDSEVFRPHFLVMEMIKSYFSLILWYQQWFKGISPWAPSNQEWRGPVTALPYLHWRLSGKSEQWGQMHIHVIWRQAWSTLIVYILFVLLFVVQPKSKILQVRCLSFLPKTELFSPHINLLY